MMKAELEIVLITAPDRENAAKIAETLIGERLAACVNIIPGIQSIYHWQGKIERGEEVLLIVKTTAHNYSKLEARVKEIHPYDTPEIVAISTRAVEAKYLKWALDALG